MPNSENSIRVIGARQNNLKNLDLALPLGELLIVTGVSGSGKSSLAFDTLYAEGQRRYIETFSAYARQFLDRMDKPQVERIDGIPPAIAIDQANPIRTSRSTVGSMSELNDHIKLLFARAARLHCNGCGHEVRRDSPASSYQQLGALGDSGGAALVTFPVEIPSNFSRQEILGFLALQGYTRIHQRHGKTLEVIQDRLCLHSDHRERIVEALEAAFRLGNGRAAVYPLDKDRKALAPLRFSSALHCARCDLHYRDPIANLFSFNSPVGACETCRGFGRVIGIDWRLVIPDPSKTLRQGAIKPLQSDSYLDVQGDLLRHAKTQGVPDDVPWCELSQEHQRWVIDGTARKGRKQWYGMQKFFDWLDSKSYKMHIRVLLSKYRSYDPCPACGGARLKDQALLWRLGGRTQANQALAPARRFQALSSKLPRTTFEQQPGLCIQDIMALPIERSAAFFDSLRLAAPLDRASAQLLGEIRGRLRYLCEVGLGYLTLERQSRTLSGGEVQRINLTSALGSALVNTLFVLDEPSIGLHSRDIQRLIAVLQRLRDAGNSLLVVEHDPELMLASDRILDLGPGPGESGGQVVAFDTPQNLLRHPTSLTAHYLRGQRQVASDDSIRPPDQNTAWLRIFDANAHNLKHLNVQIPLNRLVCLTGVSGSGKSTLLDEVLYRALRQHFTQSGDQAGTTTQLDGHQALTDVVFVDQSAIGKTTRSNPASYVGALEPIRRLFAAEPLAVQRDYNAGTFSFNAGKGRCPACAGSGFEHVEMQFLSDVYLRCPQCNGRRYRADVLEVKLALGDHQPALSIAEVLALTVTEALAFFDTIAAVKKALQPLQAVGLGYLRLGQPVPTLSGGEAQRLKLAGHLAKSGGRRKTAAPILFLFDEPTTGLHFEDIATLLKALRQLLEQGHSLLVIEHNLDVIAAADWLIDLGPEGGEAGGELLCEGRQADLMACARSHTGHALQAYLKQPSLPCPSAADNSKAARPADPQTEVIRIINAREHNLRGLDIDIPRGQFNVISGLSGSGKSTWAFDILFAEGQRRYLESLNAYARQFVQPATRAAVDAVQGIPPTVAIEQRSSRGGRKSTVATLTEIHHFLRLLFVKLAIQYCPDCNLAIQPQSADNIIAQLLDAQRGRRISLLAPLVVARKGLYNELAAWAAAKGYAQLRVDGQLQTTKPWPKLERFKEHDIDLPLASLMLRPATVSQLEPLLEQALQLGKGRVRIAWDGAQAGEILYSTERACSGCGRGFDELDPRLFSYNSKHGWCPACYGTGAQLDAFDEQQSGEEKRWQAADGENTAPCPQCQGQRLRPEALAVRLHGLSLAELSALPVSAAAAWLRDLPLSGRAADIARDILKEITARLAFLINVGLPYLSLDRAAPSLSGGEAQRIRLAAQLGSNLRGVCYLLDEPSIGLHPRDNRLLLDTLEQLTGNSNTVVVVEHDEQTLRRAQHLIDLGPGAGSQGGQLIAQGDLQTLISNPASLTGRYLGAPLRHPLQARRPVHADSPRLRIRGARRHNLRGLDISLPLQRLVCVSGVSGSGKSTLVRDVLRHALQQRLAGKTLRDCEDLQNWEPVERVLQVDQTPIGKTPRSCPATYIGFFDSIRKLFADTVEARLRGFGAGRFSFNVKGGRCDACDGQGTQRFEMNFLPDVEVTCDSCGGQRFNAETLSVRYKQKNIADVLAMNVDQAITFFAAISGIRRPLALLQEVGLGYLTLGQRSSTLSGGEAQRIKLVTELAKTKPASEHPRAARHTLYILDEPTIGLHMADEEKLIRALHRLVDSGNSVLLIEHSLDLMAEADWLIDLGPEGGDNGGQLMAEGTPEQVSQATNSHTAAFLKPFLLSRSRPTDEKQPH
jgi:excinuclease ABC subunit A